MMTSTLAAVNTFSTSKEGHHTHTSQLIEPCQMLETSRTRNYCVTPQKIIWYYTCMLFAWKVI